jgi:hypothetical protein
MLHYEHQAQQDSMPSLLPLWWLVDATDTNVADRVVVASSLALSLLESCSMVSAIRQLSNLLRRETPGWLYNVDESPEDNLPTFPERSMIHLPLCFFIAFCHEGQASILY